MFDSIVKFSIRNRLFVGLFTLLLLGAGIYSMVTLPVDAVPDITNNQVQVVTISPTLAPQEIEQLITFPIEISMSNIMNVVEIRSVSRFGLSVVTVVFKEEVPTLDARQLVHEQIQSIAGEIPAELGVPDMMPISTGLGEIYQYVLEVEPGYEKQYNAMELRTIQDWIVKRQLSGIPGIVEINSFGGYLKEYEVAIDPSQLFALDITISDVFTALSNNNQNTGGSYIEKGANAYYIRSEGMVKELADIENIVVTNRNGVPILVHDIARVSFGSPKRFGAMTMDGKGECVGGIALMLKGANANEVTSELEKRVEKVQTMLPAGVKITPYLNRAQLVSRNISTVVFNLIEGAIIVFLVLILFLGNVRAGIIVATVIPLAMLFAFILMRIFGVSANLMSLGAIDFGIVVDGAIVLVEGVLAHLYVKKNANRTLSKEEMELEVEKGISKVVRSATFAVLIILIVFFPILTLTGIEGKYFTPMAQTLVFCIIGALILSLTYVPMMSALLLKRKIDLKPTLADKFFTKLNKLYQPLLNTCIRFSWSTILLAFATLGGSIFLFTRLGSEFIPTLDEGDFAMQMTLPAGSSLSKSIETSTRAEQLLIEQFPEIKHVVSKIGTAEVPTDPMAVEDGDIMIIMKPFKEWSSASSRGEMVEKMKKALEPITDVEFNFSQPIQLRFNELMTGAKTDLAIKLYGEDMEELYTKARQAASYIEQIPGASDVLVEQAMGLPQLVVKYNRDRISQYGVNIKEINDIIRTAYAGESAGTVFENERRFDLVVRLDQKKVADLSLQRFFVHTSEGTQIPLSEFASIEFVNGPLQINRDATKRRIVVGVNVRNADIGQVVADIQATLQKNIELKPGYYFEYGGQFENLQNAINTLLIVIPIALLLILLLLFFAFRSVVFTLVVFSTIPLSLIGGILALWLRGLPFSISAGVGFIALFGVAVLNGILMINHFNEIRHATTYSLTTNRIIKKGTPHLLRPVFLTGLVASLGFVPMAIATTAGAEVQRPLATVVIGGLIVSTILTLLIIPIFYQLVKRSTVALHKWKLKRSLVPLLLLLLLPATATAQNITLEQAMEQALQNDPRLKEADTAIERNKAARGESWELSSTTLQYSHGKLNGLEFNDKQWNIEQSLGSLITPFYKNALVKNEVNNATLYRSLVAREVVAEVKRAWYSYLHATALYNLYVEQKELAERLKRVGAVRYEAGEISLLEQKVSLSISLGMQNLLMQAGREKQLAAERLQWACFSNQPITPTELFTQPTAINETAPIPSTLYLNYYEGVAAAQKAAYRVEKSRLFPELFAGYQRQSILPDKGLNSFSVGVSVPIFFFPQRSRIRQAGFAAQEAKHQSEQAIRNLNIRLIELQTALMQCMENIEVYQNSLLPEAEELKRVTTVQLRNEEIDITQAVQALNTALEIERSYLEILLQSHIATLEYQLYN